ncbi:MAG: tryptophan synthase subunit alpha [Gammaproteobacteria bacterium]|nr:tryptophan synthase subunit alpha [Gammaproteobacteria bacterium]NNF60173.1 tryptophan synthase subunit alpha [Gammaproteobacteria bacterium]NNM21586.1 tryptophan synthase subunit alpha [Gammaproteobacteria bacterium]
MTGAAAITAAIEAANADGRPALVPFITAGYPDRQEFAQHLQVLSGCGDVVEVGVPFTDPLADGVTIQRSSEAALKAGVSLDWILTTLQQSAADRAAPVILMSYLNPLLAMGYEQLAERCIAAGVAGFIVPDLPWEESAPLRAALEPRGLALVQLVSPVTTADRMKMLCEASAGFVYAVTVTGVTGGNKPVNESAILDYLDRVRSVSPIPVCAGFGIREASQVEQIGLHAEGVIVGSALVEVLEQGGDARAFLQSLGGKQHD